MDIENIKIVIQFAGNAGFQETMTLKRFEKISRYFHLNDNTTQGPRGTQGFDRYTPISNFHFCFILVERL